MAVPEAMSVTFTGPIAEDAAFGWPESPGWAIAHGPNIGSTERGVRSADPTYGAAVLERLLKERGV